MAYTGQVREFKKPRTSYELLAMALEDALRRACERLGIRATVQARAKSYAGLALDELPRE